MKIVMVGNFEYGWDGSICDEEHISQALEQLGHTVYRLQRGSNSAYSEADFTLVAQWDGYTREFLSTLPRPIVYWAFDYQADGQAWHEELVAYADLYLSKRIADSKYPNWRWLSQDFAPAFLDKYPEKVDKDIDVLFTGSYLPWATERTSTLRAIQDKHNLRIHSFTPNEWIAQGFTDVHGPVMDEQLPELIARAKINISIDHTIEAGYWSDRNAQIMACGGLVLFRYVPMSEVRFIHGSVIMFYDAEHCVEEINQLLSMHDEDLEAVRGSGYELAHRNLMVSHRVDDLMVILDELV